MALTSYDTVESVMEKYPDAPGNLSALRRTKYTLAHGIDATRYVCLNYDTPLISSHVLRNDEVIAFASFHVCSSHPFSFVQFFFRLTDYLDKFPCQEFDLIIFNFPCTDIHYVEQPYESIQSNQVLRHIPHTSLQTVDM